MKKLIKILFIVIAAIFLVALVTPFLFKGKIMQFAKEQINNNLNARVDFSNLNLSFIKNFPNASIVLKNLTVSGIDKFENDTLLKLKAFDVRVDLISAIKMENINIKGILIDQPVIAAKVLADGKANWDIVKESIEEEEEEVDTTATEFTTKISLKKFEVRDAIIKYLDESSNMSVSLEKFNFVLRGDMSQDFTTLTINSNTGAMNFIMDGIRYLNSARLSMNINLDADLKNSIYILKENNIDLNDLSLGFEGSIEMPNEEDIKTDMKFATKKADFKTLLSLVPAIYMQDFQGIKTTGNLILGGHIKGTYNSEQNIMPNASLKLKVENAMFKYPDLPKSADNIQIDIDLNYDGIDANNSTIDINKFHVDLGGNPIDMVMNIKTPESDMNLNGVFRANLDLATLSDVLPMDDVTLIGKIESNIDFMGFMSDVENEEYEKFKADGFLHISELVYNSADMPKAFKINQSSVQFSPKYVEVSSFDAEIGNSDMVFTGRLENFIAYIFKDGTIKGDFKFASNVLDLNEFMTETDATDAAVEDSVTLSVIEIPDNIDFRLDAKIEKILYDKLVIDKTRGIIIVRDGKAKLENLNMNMLEGSMLLNGEYNTKNIKSPMVDFRIKADSIDIPSAVRSFEVLEKLAPIAKSATGKVSLDMGYTSFLDEQMSPVMNSIVGKGSFASSNIALLKSPTFAKLGDVLKTKAFDKMSLDNLKVNFEIRNGRIYIDPFETKMGAGSLIIAGDQGIDQTMNYNMNVNMPRSLLGTGANAAINQLYANAALKGLNISPSEHINMNVKVGGTFTAPDISVDLKDNVRQSAQAIKEEIKEQALEEINKKKEEAKAIVSEQAQKIIAEAEAQAEKIKDEAARLSDLTRNEANINADKLEKEATNPIAKKAAEITANKIRQQGDEKAQFIIKEADEKANKLIEEAKERAGKLTQ
ncbi:MAG: AsmA-like C-terminal region-containing protein [Bacteroidales bacterium]